jgi:hypothetical protein
LGHFFPNGEICKSGHTAFRLNGIENDERSSKTKSAFESQYIKYILNAGQQGAVFKERLGGNFEPWQILCLLRQLMLLQNFMLAWNPI